MLADTTTVLSLVVAILGVGLAGLTALLNYQQKSREMFYEALDWLSGKTQRRNVGIAVIEGLWKRRFVRDVSVPLLANSAIYLLREADKTTEHELNNLRRIMDLLLRQKPKKRHLPHYRYLREALNPAPPMAQSSAPAGLKVEEDDLRRWRDWLNANLA